ncbi:hypothetical protein AB0758_00575 [Tolypothrix bouteillei VB521301_2]
MVFTTVAALLEGTADRVTNPREFIDRRWMSYLLDELTLAYLRE